MAGGRLPSLEPEAFDGTRLRREGTWAVVFLAEWCPYCRSFEPEFAGEAARGGASFARVDLSRFDNPLWDRFEIEVVPSIVVFRDGDPVLRLGGRAGEGLDANDLRSMRGAFSAAARRRSPGPG